MDVLLESADRTRAAPSRRAQMARWRELRRRAGSIVSSNYDVSDVCNLTCEGCLYFSGRNYVPQTSKPPLSAWRTFFADEAARGVNFGYFAGAEPSLTQGVLRAALSHLPAGMIVTNGIKPIAKDIRYRIHVSLWGDPSTSRALRGASNVRKALRNYSGDDRAVAIYTINRHNVDQIEAISELCADHDIPLSFSYFSPTDDYLARLDGEVAGKSDYFRVSSEDDNLRLEADDFARARHAIEDAVARHPHNIWYSLAYDNWITQPGGVYTVDTSGVAVDCGSRMSKYHRHYNADMKLNTGKCCSPNIDCRECRPYAQGYATFLNRAGHFAKTPEGLDFWLDVWELWLQLFLLPEHLSDTQARPQT